MLIRAAAETDAKALNRLIRQLGYPGLSEYTIQKRLKRYQQDDYAFLVTEIDNEVVAFIALHWFDFFHLDGRIGRISAFCVDEGHRSKGIGIQLLEEAERVFKLKGCSKIEVTSHARRTLTHQFYLNREYLEESKRFSKVI